MTYFIAPSSSLLDCHAVRRTTSQEIDSSTPEILTSPVLELHVASIGRRPHPSGQQSGFHPLKVVALAMATSTGCSQTDRHEAQWSGPTNTPNPGLTSTNANYPQREDR